MVYALTWLDVFTSRPLAGNGLAVVHDADDVSDETMLAFARETRLSETTFVQTATDAGADYRNRFWMTQGELPFAGHPSLGTAVALARAGGERAASYVQQTGAGLAADRGRSSATPRPTPPCVRSRACSGRRSSPGSRCERSA